MKRVFRMAAICMLLCGLVLPLSVHAKEANAQIMSKMTNISTYSTELSISSDGIASASGFVNGKSGVTSTYVKVTLQKSV